VLEYLRIKTLFMINQSALKMTRSLKTAQNSKILKIVKTTIQTINQILRRLRI
jgi:hypothetical protein